MLMVFAIEVAVTSLTHTIEVGRFVLALVIYLYNHLSLMISTCYHYKPIEASHYFRLQISKQALEVKKDLLKHFFNQ